MRIRLAYRRPMHIRLTSLLPRAAGRVRTHTSDLAGREQRHSEGGHVSAHARPDGTGGISSGNNGTKK
jgi:hypothetical protein